MHEWEHPRHFTLGHEVDGDYVTEVPEYAVDDSSSENEPPHENGARKRPSVNGVEARLTQKCLYTTFGGRRIQLLR